MAATCTGSMTFVSGKPDVLRTQFIIAAVRWVFSTFTVLQAPRLPIAHCIQQDHVATMHTGSTQIWVEEKPPVCENDIGIHSCHIQMVYQGAFFPVGHIPEGL